MKTTLILISILTLLQLYGCSEEDVIVEPKINIPESSANIIGVWESGTTKYTFSENGDYNKYWALKTYPDVIYSYVNESGKYEIVDSVLILKSDRWSFSNPESMIGISIIPTYNKIGFNDGKLILKRVRVFIKENGDNTKLLGTWKMLIWPYHKTSSPNKVEYYGRQEEYYNFFSSDSVLYGNKYLDGTPFTESTLKFDYHYEHPLINIFATSISDNTVEFKEGKMYWFDSYPATYFSRIK